MPVLFGAGSGLYLTLPVEPVAWAAPAAAGLCALAALLLRRHTAPALAAMRDSGLAHLLAISGLHVGLVAGFIFFAVRGLLALVEPLALRRPIKKWAAALLAIAVGGLWLCRWCFLGIAVIAGGLLLTGLEQRPDILVDGSARVMAVRDEDGRLWLSTRQRGCFVSDTWLWRDGQAEAPTWPAAGAGAAGAGLRCDTLGCIQQRKGRTLAFVRDPRALDKDCGRADLVVSAVPAWDLCPGPGTVVDRFDLWRGRKR